MNLTKIHDAMYNRLDAHVGIPIYDYVPPEVRPPFMVMEKMYFEIPDNITTKTSEAYQIRQVLLVITNAREKRKAIETIANINKSLEEPLEIEGSFLLRQKMTSGSIEETEDALYIAETGIELWLEDYEEVI